ncbi:MAG: hypothetical protein QXT25_01785 [Candidatus Anstonellaceae archaeon]
MLVDETKMVLAASLVALCGIAVLFLFVEHPYEVSVAQALLEQENRLVKLQGSADNLTSNGFNICSSEGLCIKVNAKEDPILFLVRKGSQVEVVGRIKAYQKTRYVEAEKIKIM